MKKIAVISITLVFFSLPSSFSQGTESTLIALSILREDLIKNLVKEEILLIGKYSDGKYKVVSYWGGNVKGMVSSRKVLLNAHEKFTVFSKGTAIKEVTIKEICTTGFDCEELTVGCGESKPLVNNLKDFQSNLTTESLGGSKGKPFWYKTTYYIALNSDSSAIDTQQYSTPLNNLIPEEHKKSIYEYAKNKLLQKNELIKSQDINIPTLLTYNLNRDKLKDYIVVAKAENDKTKESGIFVVNVIDDKVVPILAKDLTNRPSSWGNGYKLADVLDIDGDRKPEIIFQVRGYESTGYEIYKWKDNQFIQVFDDVTYGC